jgi:3-hydroxyisobutyrate dehydrogenase-like beta-hydroxyacid dehydrogenase
MTQPTPTEPSLADELRELGRQLTATVRAIAGSEQVRTLGRELHDGLRDAAQEVETTVATLRQREEVQQLRARATGVAESFKTGEAQRDIRDEVADALRALNTRLGELVTRVDSPTDTSVTPGPSGSTSDPSAAAHPYTGTTQKLEP